MRELEAKAKTVSWEKEKRKTWFVLFSVNGFTEDLRAEAAARTDLRLYAE